MRTRLLLLLVLSCLVPVQASAWGGDVHRLINGTAVECLPPEFAAFGQWQGDLERLASEADRRKSWDSSEGPRHYIDIDVYPEFFSRSFPREYHAALALYGRSRLEDNGLLPWAIEDTWFELVAAFQARDWNLAVARAADLGHYVGDLHNPMHLTENFNGQLTGQNGIHSRHESEMTQRYLAWLSPVPRPAPPVEDLLSSVFDWIYETHPGVDRILAADRTARQAAGGSTASDLYYEVLFQEVGQDTYYWISHAGVSLAGLWTAAWRAAGSPPLPGSTPVLPLSVTRLKTLDAVAP